LVATEAVAFSGVKFATLEALWSTATNAVNFQAVHLQKMFLGKLGGTRGTADDFGKVLCPHVLVNLVSGFARELADVTDESTNRNFMRKGVKKKPRFENIFGKVQENFLTFSGFNQRF